MATNANPATVSTVITGSQLVVGDGYRFENVKPTTNTAYKRGDLIAVSSVNVATHAADASSWQAIVATDMSAAQSTAHVNAGLEMSVYVQGAFDVDVVTLNSVGLDATQKTAARAKGLTNKIELRKVVGG